MAYTADYVFEKVMHMHDDGDESTGLHDTADNKEYKNRMLPLINQRLSELYQYTTPVKATSGKQRPTVPRLTSWDDEIDLDDFCLDVLCFGVAALMFTVEDTTSANYYQQEYERLLRELQSGRGLAAEAEAITDVYSGSYTDADGNIQYFTGYYPYSEFGRWG